MFNTTPPPASFIRRPTARAITIVAVTSTASSSSSLRSNGQPAASPVRVSAPALLTHTSRPFHSCQACVRQPHTRRPIAQVGQADGGACTPARRTSSAAASAASAERP